MYTNQHKSLHSNGIKLSEYMTPFSPRDVGKSNRSQIGALEEQGATRFLTNQKMLSHAFVSTFICIQSTYIIYPPFYIL